MVFNSVNLRTRADPPLSEYHFGNLIGASVTEVAAGDDGVEFLRKVREATKALSADYVARRKEREMQLKEVIRAQALANEVEVRLVFSSTCRFPVYEADFGWGRPVWVGYGGSPYKNVVYFMDRKSGGGIDALIQLSKQDMEKFEAHLMLKSNL
ncbi:salutaridinol 7-O-acetyltransferase-like [Salvia miltiorrhiza]|uniref:salutaridinol 7-O-acetyltransferase-like n=1 Tax=Salvia miltiorrhiza TaxID=226208 RepID=UPI0025AC4CFB|nr:salutaridinol 7-O-acetyltransferase-like [Salvia miltiorrhiza]